MILDLMFWFLMLTGICMEL